MMLSVRIYHCAAARTMSVRLDILNKQVFNTATITHTLSSTTRRELKATDCLSISPKLYYRRRKANKTNLLAACTKTSEYHNYEGLFGFMSAHQNWHATHSKHTATARVHHYCYHHHHYHHHHYLDLRLAPASPSP